MSPRQTLLHKPRAGADQHAPALCAGCVPGQRRRTGSTASRGRFSVRRPEGAHPVRGRGGLKTFSFKENKWQFRKKKQESVHLVFCARNCVRPDLTLAQILN